MSAFILVRRRFAIRCSSASSRWLAWLSTAICSSQSWISTTRFSFRVRRDLGEAQRAVFAGGDRLPGQPPYTAHSNDVTAPALIAILRPTARAWYSLNSAARGSLLTNLHCRPGAPGVRIDSAAQAAMSAGAAG